VTTVARAIESSANNAAKAPAPGFRVGLSQKSGLDSMGGVGGMYAVFY
jgi:hypothetical protein